MAQAKKLIEVAMPIKEISAESVRDGRIQHGHISSLHKWWARRPLPVCRAVVFASLVPDPVDDNCPNSFKEAVELILGNLANPGDPYKPYDDIPYTSAIDQMEDNLRNRLLMFIGKFSNDFIENEKQGKITNAKETLSASSLIKWDNKNNEPLLNKARKLIWVANNTQSGKTAIDLLNDFDSHYKSIKDSEQELYSTPDRHLTNVDLLIKESALQNAIEAFWDKMPKVFDPFAGGGAIPLEAARLGCRSYGNDINPVAFILQKGSTEYPQKFGKPITYSKSEFVKQYGQQLWNQQPHENKIVTNGEAVAVKINNRIAFDVDIYSSKILSAAESEIGHLYPKNKNGESPLAYYWAKVVTCSNPSCKAEVPMLKGFDLVKTKNRKVHLYPIISGNRISFEVRNGSSTIKGWADRGNLRCPCCGNTTDAKTLKAQFIEGKSKEQILAVIWEGVGGKVYTIPNELELEITKTINNISRPTEIMPVAYTQALPCCTWGMKHWSDLFNNRQLYSSLKIVEYFVKIKQDLENFEDNYKIALITYLGIWIDRMVSRLTSFGLIDIGRDTIVDLFGRQAIPMVFDYPEVNPFKMEQSSWIIKVIESESFEFPAMCNNASSGEKAQFSKKYLTAVITDPPYYDAIAYADLSDFFYVWLKRTLGNIFPSNFATPQTPKSEECTALKHHHNGNLDKANQHFENKLLEIFDTIEYQTSDIVSIMFAHQSTEAWTTLCNSILGSRMNITGSWANDTETITALKTNKAFLSSSVTVCAKPAQRKGIGEFKEVKQAIEQRVSIEVDQLYRLGFRGADLLTACFGQAVSEFGKYEKVEKADGNDVTVAELLEMARESAFNALLKGFDGDDCTKFYIGWLQLYSFTESEFDDAAKFSRVGLSINVHELFNEHILMKNGNKQTLGGFQERLQTNRNLGDNTNSFLIDQVHRAMALYKGANRGVLLQYIKKVASNPESSFWRVVTSLCEVLPAGSEDLKQALGLLMNKDSLIRESKTVGTSSAEQTTLFN